MDVHVRSQTLAFSEDMSSEQLALWLRNHPSLSEAEYEEDISKLRGICYKQHNIIVNGLIIVDTHFVY